VVGLSPAGRARGGRPVGAALATGAWLLVGLSMALAAQDGSGPAVARQPVVIGTKPFAESYLLGELFAQMLEARRVPVARRFGLGGTDIVFPALQRGDIDLYPEYTGSGMLVVLKLPPLKEPAAVFETVSREFATRYDLRWLPPLGFENTYAMSVRTEMAERLGLRTLSDFARVSGDMRAGLTADFIGRPDGLPGLSAAYGMTLKTVSPLAPAVKYQALASGAVDIVDAYSTDGLLARYPITVLTDDRRFFPPYDAAALVRGALMRDRPEAVAALTELSGRLDVRRMRALNARVEVGGEAAALVAADALHELGLVTGSSSAGEFDPTGRGPTAPAQAGRATSFASYLWERRGEIARLTLRHLLLVAVSLGLAVLVAVPLGVGLERVSAAEAVIGGLGVLQTIPGIALLAFMLPVLGIGFTPAIVALFLYSLYPIARSTYTGVREADRAAADAATALGMTPGQVLRHVRLPLALPVIMSGVRTAAVLNVGTATLAAFIGAGGLGEPVVAGLALADTRMVLSGAVPSALLALAVDRSLGLAQRLITRRRRG
jgi:osmoprotectant transport system permease protein